MTHIIKSLQELHTFFGKMETNKQTLAVFERYEDETYQFPSLFRTKNGIFQGHQSIKSTNDKCYSHKQLTDWGYDTTKLDEFYETHPEYTL